MLMTRRDFLQSSLAAAGAAGLPLPKAPLAIKKGLVFDMVPGNLPYADRFKLVRDAGFQVVQALTEQLKVVIAIEEVWNRFLLSPLEMAQYIGEFHSPWIRAWFDVGNVVLYGYPQDWIRTLGKAIVKVHLKDFKRTETGYAWVNLGDGDVDWPAVRQAFADIGYDGSVIAELEQGDEQYLRDVSRRIDRLLLG